MPETRSSSTIGTMCPSGETERTSNALTLLRASGRLLCKRYDVHRKTGDIIPIRFRTGTWFAAEVRHVKDIRELFELARELEGKHDLCAVSGALAPTANPRKTRRRKGTELVDVPRAWMVFDLDDVPRPPTLAMPASPIDLARALYEILVEALPALRDVSCVVRLSASAFLADLAHTEAAKHGRSRWSGIAKSGLSGHIWIWLKAPLTEEERRRLMKAVNERVGYKLLDPAIAGISQPICTAAPAFRGGLLDPLAGCRTFLFEGPHDAATLDIPSPVIRRTKRLSAVQLQPKLPVTESAESHEPEIRNEGIEARLAAIGPQGFHAPILSAIGAQIAVEGADLNVAELKAKLRRRIRMADPGQRSEDVIARYLSDEYLDPAINALLARELAKRSAKRDLHDRAEVSPEHPGPAMALADAEAALCASLDRFERDVSDGQRVRLMIGASAGLGKTTRVIQRILALIAAARRGGWSGAAVIALPRHALIDEVAGTLRDLHPGLRVRVWRGRDAPDPDVRGARMCLWPELPHAALDAGFSAEAVCATCALREQCGYRRQERGPADIWIVTHHWLFRPLPEGLPPACLVITDEAWWSAGLIGLDANEPCDLPVSALLSGTTGDLPSDLSERLLHLRGRMAAAVARCIGMPRLQRAALEAEGLTAHDLCDLASLERRSREPMPDLPSDPGHAEAMLRAHSTRRFAERRALLSDLAAELAGSTSAETECIRVRGSNPDSFSERGVIELAWRRELAGWVTRAPMLILDATTRPGVVWPWMSDAELQYLHLEVEMPTATVRQVVGREWSRRFLTSHPEAIAELATLVVVELARSKGDVLVVVQAAAEDLLRAELIRQLRGTLPARLHLTHHGGLTGTNAYATAERVIVVGRQALSVDAAERIAAVLRNGMSDGPRLASCDADVLWPVRAAGIRLARGTGLEVRQPTHPDALVNDVRMTVSEGSVIQAAARIRSVRREDPTAITILGELALPLTVHEVCHWERARPDRLVIAGARSALSRTPLLMSPEWLHKCHPDLWETETAARRHLEANWSGEIPPVFLVRDALKGLGGFIPMVAVEYRTEGSRGRWSRALVPAGTDPLTSLQRVRPQVIAVRSGDQEEEATAQSSSAPRLVASGTPMDDEPGAAACAA
ncbi:hypothetical protein [Falsiroseomonas oryzae]|uniref:hypothetical protein n=1 Tax=Falsiroseomonas oryzae TaxID=2766473 RepID=UPI0022EB94BF|nr:hypothetical protein [Roseomonas sp. MO-31]